MHKDPYLPTCSRAIHDVDVKTHHEKPNEADVSTASFSSDDSRHCKVNLSNLSGIVAWTDSRLQEQQTSDLHIDLHADTAKRQAVFTLSGWILTKDEVKTHLHLLVYPEKIQSIEFTRTPSPIPTTQEDNDGSERYISLRFTLAQPPTLVAPRGSLLEPKPRYQSSFDAMMSLATANQFSVYLYSLNVLLETRQQLAMLPSVFSSAHPYGVMRTDEKRVLLETLFRGAPGQVIDLGKTAPPSGTNANQTLAEVVDDMVTDPAPPYPTDRKRRASKSLSPLGSPAKISNPSGMLPSHVTINNYLLRTNNMPV